MRSEPLGLVREGCIWKLRALAGAVGVRAVSEALGIDRYVLAGCMDGWVDLDLGQEFLVERMYSVLSGEFLRR